jgi:hypothetical protein
MVTQVIPTLTTAGFVSDVPTMIDRMLAYYIASDFSQSNLFQGKILSLQKQMQAYQYDNNQLITSVREELEGYFGSIADSVTVEVSTDLPNPEDPNRINVRVSVIVVKSGKQYSIGRLIETQDSITQRIFDANNGARIS